MRRRDAVAGALVAGAVVAALVGTVGGILPIRTAGGVVIVLGLAAAVAGGWWTRPVGDPAVVAKLAALGLLTSIAAIVTVVAGRPESLIVLVVLTTGLWLLASVRHASTRR